MSYGEKAKEMYPCSNALRVVSDALACTRLVLLGGCTLASNHRALHHMIHVMFIQRAAAAAAVLVIVQAHRIP